MAAPVPSGAATDPDVHLNSVSCAPATSCVAVGSYKIASGTSRGLLETLKDGTWKPATAATRDASSTSLGAVSCLAANNCVLVGNTAAEGVLGTMAGDAWTLVPAPLVPPATLPVFIGQVLSCPSTSVCVAFGVARLGYGPTGGLFEMLNR